MDQVIVMVMVVVTGTATEMVIQADSSCANAGCGNNILARDHAAQAVNMEPGNPQYRQLLNQLEFGSNRYSNSPYGGGYAPGSSNSCGTGNLCCDLWIADSLCECMGGDLCTCI